MLKIRLKPEDSHAEAFSKLKLAVKDLQKDQRVARLKDINVKDGQVDLDGEILPLTGKAESQLYDNLGLQKLNQLAGLVPVEDGRQRIKDEIIRGAFKTLEGKAMRFHLVTNLKGEREIQSVQSTKFEAVNEVEVLEAAESATAEFGFVPFSFSYDEDRSFLQLVRFDKELKLPAMKDRWDSHHIQRDDRANGLITLKISPVEANEVTAGWFQHWCTNSSIFDGETEMTIRATRTQGLSLEHILPGLIKGIISKQDQSGEKILRMHEEVFGDRHFIETMFENFTLKRIYQTFVQHELEEIEQVRGTRADAWNVITKKAHTIDLEPVKAIQMEKIGGRYLMATAVN